MSNLPETPISRVEQYLSNIAGEEHPLPAQPLSRVEQYLAYIAEHGGGGGGDVTPVEEMFTGLWAANTPYKVHQLVIHDHKLYSCILKHTSGSTFNASYWTQTTMEEQINNQGVYLLASDMTTTPGGQFLLTRNTTNFPYGSPKRVGDVVITRTGYMAKCDLVQEMDGYTNLRFVGIVPWSSKLDKPAATVPADYVPTSDGEGGVTWKEQQGADTRVDDIISGVIPVELAVNLTTDDTVNDTAAWLRRTTAGDASIANGKVTVKSVAGNNSTPIHTQGAATANKTEVETASISFTDPTTLTEESYTLSFDGEGWTLNGEAATLSDYGVTLTGTAYSGDAIFITKTEDVYSASYVRASRLTMVFTLATWLHKAELDGTALGSYEFIYDGGWKLGGAVVDPSVYGISITGTAVDGDSVTVSYTAESDYGHIEVTTPTAVVSTGINSYSGGNNFNPASVLEDFTIDENGDIVPAAGKSVGFAWCIDGTNGWIVGHREAIDRVAFSATVPAEDTTGMTVLAKDDDLSSEGAYEGQAYYNDGYVIPAEGYIVFCGSDLELVSTHPHWSGEANWRELGNADYAPYTETVVNLIGKPMTRNITRIAYTPAALDELLEEHTDWVKNTYYAWDNDYIYHVSEPVSGVYAADTELWSVGNTRDTIDVLTDSVANDYGVEEVRGTTRAPMVTIAYLANLKNQLRHSVRYDGQVLTAAQQAAAQTTLGIGMKIASTLPANAALNTIYFLGTVAAVATALPNGTKVGDMVSIIWYNGETPATVTITGQILPFSFTPTASNRSEVSAMWDGANWSLVAYEQAVV